MLKNFPLCFSICCFVTFTVVSQVDTIPTLVQANKDIPKEVIRSTTDFRERLLADPYRPAYHFCIPEDKGYPFDPNGAFYHNGLYHLMYLYERGGQEFSWGHVSSTDMLHWRRHPDALRPGNGDEGAFSGGAFVDDDGSAVLSYWMLWGAKGIGLAKSSDLHFNTWKKFDNNPVIKSTEWGITDIKNKHGKSIHIGSADPSNIWKKEGRYHMLTGNLLVLRKYGSRGKALPASMVKPELPKDSLDYQGDRLYLYTSENLKDWNYMHEFYKSDRKWTEKTEDNMCPSFLPLPSSPDGGPPSEKHLLLFISHSKGSQYYVGDYTDDKFFPTVHGRMTWNDNAYFAPEALVDGKGRQIMWAWIFDDRPDSLKTYYGWTGTYGLPRSLWLGEDGTLRMRPIKEMETLRINQKIISAITVKSGTEVPLKDLGSELMELEITVDPKTAAEYGVKIGMSEDGREETRVYFDQKK